MSRRRGDPDGLSRGRAVATGTAAAGILVAVVVALAQDPPGELGPGAPKPFPHAGHVPVPWLNEPEVARDCLGCHGDPRSGNAPDVRSASGGGLICGNCHSERFRASGEWPPLVEASASFCHSEHASVYECKQCHDPGHRGDIGVPAEMPVPQGLGWCVFCHDPAEEGKNDAALAKLGAFLARLNDPRIEDLGPRDFRGEGDGFRHEDHLARWPPQPARWREDCLPCHGETAAAAGLRPDGTPDLGERVFGIEACAPCHVSGEAAGRGQRPRQFVVANRSRTSLTAGTFAHADHFRAPRGPVADEDLARGRERIEREGCFACHERAGATFGMRAEFSGERGAYEACFPCHEANRVERIEGPAHAALEDDTGPCAGCHVLGFIADMKAARPAVEVAREYPVEGFRFEKHVHPFITREKPAGEEAVAETCARCHRAALPELESRLRQRPFVHATHLPEKPSAEQCAGCHTGIARTEAPRKILSLETLVDAKSCETCHRGSTVTPLVAEPETLEAREVPLFSHADHVGKAIDGRDGDRLDCLLCHDGEIEKGEAAIGTRPEALACVPCHGHERAPLTTGKVSQRYVENCTYCHRRGVPPAREPLVDARRRWIAGIEGRQFHPQPNDRPCGDCHVHARLAFRYRVPHEITGAGYYKGSRDPDDRFHRNGRPANCMGCHWAEQDKRTPPGVGREYVKLRADVGGSLRGFPGR